MAQKDNIDQKRVKHILSCLENSDSFTLELVAAINKAQSSGGQEDIDDCLEYWEDVAELHCIPDFKKNSWDTYNALVTAGVVTP